MAAAIEKVVIVAIGVPVIAGEPDRHLFGYNRPANESAGRIIIEISVAGADHALGGVRRVTREHLDRADGRVTTEQRGLWSLEHFDPPDLRQVKPAAGLARLIAAHEIEVDIRLR